MILRCRFHPEKPCTSSSTTTPLTSSRTCVGGLASTGYLHFHFTPGVVLVAQRKLARCRLKRGVFRSVVDLQIAINSSRRQTMIQNPSPGLQTQIKPSPLSGVGT